jgi:hypothetical protein
MAGEVRGWGLDVQLMGEVEGRFEGKIKGWNSFLGKRVRRWGVCEAQWGKWKRCIRWLCPTEGALVWALHMMWDLWRQGKGGQSGEGEGSSLMDIDERRGTHTWRYHFWWSRCISILHMFRRRDIVNFPHINQLAAVKLELYEFDPGKCSQREYWGPFTSCGVVFGAKEVEECSVRIYLACDEIGLLETCSVAAFAVADREEEKLW